MHVCAPTGAHICTGQGFPNSCPNSAPANAPYSSRNTSLLFGHLVACRITALEHTSSAFLGVSSGSPASAGAGAAIASACIRLRPRRRASILSCHTSRLRCPVSEIRKVVCKAICGTVAQAAASGSRQAAGRRSEGSAVSPGAFAAKFRHRSFKERSKLACTRLGFSAHGVHKMQAGGRRDLLCSRLLQARDKQELAVELATHLRLGGCALHRRRRVQTARQTTKASAGAPWRPRRLLRGSRVF